MSALRDVVERHVVRPAVAGPSEGRFDRKAMQQELARLRRSREVGFWLLFLLFALILSGAAAMIFRNRDDPQTIQSLSAATGVTLMGIMAALVNLWAQKTRADLTIAIASGMSDDGAIAALNVLLPKL